jgi:hypothetical protein
LSYAVGVAHYKQPPPDITMLPTVLMVILRGKRVTRIGSDFFAAAFAAIYARFITPLAGLANFVKSGKGKHVHMAVIFNPRHSWLLLAHKTLSSEKPRIAAASL